MGVVSLREHDAGQTEHGDDKDRSEGTEQPIGEVAADDRQGREVCYQRHEDEVADNVVVVRGDAASEVILDGDEHGKTGDELLIAETEYDRFQDAAGSRSVRSSGKRQSQQSGIG